MSDSVYTIHIIDDEKVSISVVCDDCWTEAEALNRAYFWLGRYRSHAARLYRSEDSHGNPIDLVAEIRPPKWITERDRQYAEAGVDLPTRAACEKASGA
jgi:hypothetical protein